MVSRQSPTSSKFSEKRAFNYEEGQFICHIYATIGSSENEQIIDDTIELILREQQSEKSKHENWRPICQDSETGDEDGSKFHITLVRGHRAIYYHQIRSLVSSIKTECETLKPFSLCLDKLRIFHNFERTKQFVCLATRSDQSSTEDIELKTLKSRLQAVVDQFATKLTSEDETSDTLAHCSFMFRDVGHCPQAPDDIEADLVRLDSLCDEHLDEYPMCLVKVEHIEMKIGNHTYKFWLTG